MNLLTDKHAVIRNQKSGLVLDASEKHIRMQHFTGYPQQLWKIQNAGPGKFFIVNKATKKVLDIEEGAHSGHHLITFAKHGGPNQQWSFDSDSTIVSAAGPLAVDIAEENYSAGAHVIAFHKNGNDNQVFQLQYQ